MIDKNDMIKGNNDIANTIRITADSITFGPSLLISNKLPKQYIFNGDTTILIHSDKSKTIVRTMEGDKFDPVMGFLTAYFQKHSGLSKNKANDYLMEVRKKYEEKFGKVEEPTNEEPTNKFKVGDKVTGTDDNTYGITDSSWVGYVVKILDNEEIVVNECIGEVNGYTVQSKYFKKIKEEK